MAVQGASPSAQRSQGLCAPGDQQTAQRGPSASGSVAAQPAQSSSPQLPQTPQRAGKSCSTPICTARRSSGGKPFTLLRGCRRGAGLPEDRRGSIGLPQIHVVADVDAVLRVPSLIRLDGVAILLRRIVQIERLCLHILNIDDNAILVYP